MVKRQHKLLIDTVLVVRLGLVACADNPALQIRYEAEKKYYAAEKAFEEARASTGQLSPAEFGEVYDRLRDANDFCYAGLRSIDPSTHPEEYDDVKYLAVQSSLRLARLFYTAGRFDSTQATLYRLLTDVQLSDLQRLPIYMNLGRTTQASGNLDSALTIYDFVVRDYYPPIDDAGQIVSAAFNLPEQIYRTFKIAGDSVSAATRLQEAEAYYRKLVDEHPETRLAAASRTKLADIYDDTGRWRKELDELLTLADSTAPGYEELMIRVADVYGGRLRMYDSALTIYQELSDRLKPSDTGVAPVLLFKKALVRMDQRKYPAARTLLKQLKKEFPQFYAGNPMPQYTLARSFEREENWPVAEQEYSLLIEKYQGTDEAMMSLLHLIDHFNRENRQAEAASWYKKAESYFDQVARSGIGTPLETKALFYKAELYRRHSQPETAAKILLSIFSKFPGSEPGVRGAVAAAGIYRENLGNPQKADSILTALQLQMARTRPVVQDEDLFAD